jgi:hypothetical protein
MTWLLILALFVLNLWTDIRREERAGLWSWSLFVFSLTFAALEWCILWLPMRYLPMGSRWFGLGVAASAVLAIANFVWFILICRRWKLPDGRTNLEAWRDNHPDA